MTAGLSASAAGAVGVPVDPDADEARRLANQFAIGDDAFSVVLVGKDGGEKLRVDEVPDLQSVYAVVDGMPMRSREMGADPGRC